MSWAKPSKSYGRPPSAGEGIACSQKLENRLMGGALELLVSEASQLLIRSLLLRRVRHGEIAMQKEHSRRQPYRSLLCMTVFPAASAEERAMHHVAYEDKRITGSSGKNCVSQVIANPVMSLHFLRRQTHFLWRFEAKLPSVEVRNYDGTGNVQAH